MLAESETEQWIRLSLCQEEIPLEAVLAGNDHNDNPIYVGRACHGNELLPAKIVMNKKNRKGKGFVISNGLEYEKCYCAILCGEFDEKERKSKQTHVLESLITNINFSKCEHDNIQSRPNTQSKELFEVSITSKYRWDFTNDSVIPSNAVLGGFTNTGEKIYIGRVKFENALILGKIVPSECCLFISVKGRVLKFKNYEILVRI